MEFIDITFGEDLEKFHNRIERMIGEFFKAGRSLMMPERIWNPSVDVYETPAEVIILAEIAGVSKDDIKVTLDRNIVRISGQRRERSPSPKLKLHQMEIDFGEFDRMVKITVPINEKEVTATYSNGFLQIKLPRKTPLSKVHDVEVITE